MLNKPSGNMYNWAWTWNPLGGECPHRCSYCSTNFLKKQYKVIESKYTGSPVLIEKELSSSLAKPDDDKVIFVCNMTDLFADSVPSNAIEKILEHCREYPVNTYLFQTKNPKRFFDFIDNDMFPEKTILGTTIETNKDDIVVSDAPKPNDRIPWMWELTDKKYSSKFKRMVTLEPIMDFDVRELSLMIYNCHPDFVNIGADSKNNNLSEPSEKKIQELILNLKKLTEVRLKDNLKRIY